MQTALLATGAVDLEVRALSGFAWALVQNGDVRGGLSQLERARELTERADFSDIDRADLLYRMGFCRYMLSSNATALGLFNEALALAEGSGLPCDALRAEIFHSRALLLPEAARFRGRPRGRRAGARARRGTGRPAHDGRRLPARVARRRADGPVGARAQLRRARPRPLPGAERRPQDRRRPEQPRRPEPAARPARAGDRAPEGVLQRRARGATASRRPRRPKARWRRCTCTSASGTRRRSSRATR